MKNILNFFTKDIPSFMHKDYLITFSLLLFLVFTIHKLWIENTIISIFILVIIMILLILSAIGPKSLLNFIFKYTKEGTEFSFIRQELTKEEKEFAVEIEYINIHDLENQKIYEKSINKGFKEKSDFDFLIISTKLWREKKFDEALEQAYFGLYISNDIKIKSLLTMRIGTTFSDLNKNEVAKDKYKKAISIDPQNAKAYNNLSICYMNENNFQKAKELILESLELNKQNFNTYNILGVLYSKKEFEEFSYKKAEEYLLKSIKLKPKENKPYRNIALLYMENDFEEYDLNKAKKYLLEAFNIDCEDYITLGLLGELYLRKQDYKKAIDYLLKTINYKKDSHVYYNNLGFAYLKIKNFEESKKYLYISYEIKKDFPATLDSLGELYMKLKDFKSSEKYFKKAIELDNQDTVYYNNLIKLYDKFDKNEEKLRIEKELEKIKKEKESGTPASSSQEPQ
ncbi:tetratricopeptide repeat protein [Aliarcobacter butzleri]|uniref:tetratricopeptide repeat protein n=1 Tax=Aliarcobacter butzleri TaxID=28197 RepID=UPI003B20B5F8